MSLAGGCCRRFQPNVFNSARCQNCYKVKDGHPNAAFNCAKMGRKVIACSFLYVAPPNLDFSLPSHSTKRWQRRWFSLFDDGALEVRIDNNPETVPQLKMDMKRCIRVCNADSITAHQHSLLIAFRNNQYTDEGYCINTANIDQKPNEHPVVCYVKADSSEEIRCWQSVLQVFARNLLIHAMPIRQSPSLVSLQLLEQNETSQPESRSESAMSAGSLMEQKQFTTEDANFIAEQEEDDFNDETLTTSYYPVEDESSEAKLDEEMQQGVNTQTNNDFQLPIKTPMSVPFQIDTSNMHTLRKGWLMLRGKSDSEWNKHWVVLAGLNLKLYSDVWMDDTAEPILNIDLSECENVYPSAATKNYGIEIKCKRARYVLSAMTPGIRDSWIQALQQNLHNPSPTYSEMAAASMDALSQTDSADILSITRRKKHIAYVGPESHHSNSLMDGFSSSTEADDDARTGDSSSIRPTIDIPDANAFLPSSFVSTYAGDSASINSSNDGHSNFRHPAPIINRATPPNQQQRRRSATNRQLSLSPSMRRSPVNRLKERRRIADRNLHRGAVGEMSQSIPPSNIYSRRLHPNDILDRGRESASSLQQQVQELRNQLCETKNRLSDIASENSRLKTLFSSQDLSHLRRCLHAAEENVIRQQSEMDVLHKQFVDSPSATTSSDSSSQSRSMNRQSEDCFPLEISQRLVSLLKVQVGALSQVLHSSNNATSLSNLRLSVDNLVRNIAGLDENVPQDISFFETAFDEVTNCVRNILSSMNREPENVSAENLRLLDEIRDLEQEIEQMQNSHGREVGEQRMDFERQLQVLRERVVSEENTKKRLQEELQNIHNAGSSQEQHLASKHENTVAELRQQFEEHLQKLQQDYEQELEEEKQATKLALDVVQRSHKEELQKLKNNNSIKKECKCQQERITSPVRPIESPRQKEVMELMSSELSNLSSLYSAKCLENSQLDEKLKSVVVEKEKEKSELELENSRLKKDLQQKNDLYSQLIKRLDYLEKKLKDSNSTRVALSCDYPQSAVVAQKPELPVPEPTVRFRIPKNGAASRKVSSNRRNDIRYHSNPMIPYSNEDAPPFSAYYERQFESDKKILPVRERCKFFECGPF